MKKQLRKIISVILVCYIVLLSLSVSSFAQITLINSDMTASTWSWSSYSGQPTLTYDSTNDRNKFEMNSNTPFTVRLTALATQDVYLNHSYRLSFDIWGHFEDYNFSVVLVTIENVNTESTHILTEITQNFASSDNSYHTVIIDFSPSYFVGSVNGISLDFVFNRVNGATNTRNLYIKNLTLTDNDNQSGFWNSLWQWLQDIITKIQNLGQVLNVVKDAIINKLTSITSSIGQFFVDIGEDIADLFDTITDYILYFQHPVELDEDGVPVDEYGEPIYENIFDIPDFFETLEEWVDDLDDAKTDVQTGANAGVQAFQNTIAPLTSILNRVPFLTVFITFALAIIVIKKVIG